MKILVTSIGRRVQLIKHLKLDNYIVGVDSSELNVSRYFVDSFYNVPDFNNAMYIETLIKIIMDEQIDMLIPLHESEFFLLNKNRTKLLEAGARLLLSYQDVIEVFGNKLKTYEFFLSNDILTPKTYSTTEIVKINEITYPIIIKPINGMGSKGVHKIYDQEELNYFLKRHNDVLIQEYIDGVEYTIDVLCDFEGDIISIVPRERIEVRDGEVSKSRTVKDNRIIQAVKDIIYKTNSNVDKFIGPITIQCIINNIGEIKFIEINPRFGGGVPLSFEAGINYSSILNMILNNEPIPNHMKEYKELMMIRFDDAIYV